MDTLEAVPPAETLDDPSTRSHVREKGYGAVMQFRKRKGLSRRSVVAAAVMAAATPLRVRANERLRLAHALPSSHPIHPAMENFARLVREGSGGEIDVQVFGDGQLGQEQDLVDQARAGKLDLFKVSSTLLERFAPSYRVFNLPFLLRSAEHYRAIADGRLGQEILAERPESGFVGLTFVDAGARSFYGRKPVLHPDDLAGQRIRVQPSPTMVRMIELFNAVPVVLTWSVVHGALMTRLIDGAENNLSALHGGGHADVIQHYSFTQHTFVPDVLLAGSHVWSRLTPAQRVLFREASIASAEQYSRAWGNVELEARKHAAKLGVEFHTPNKLPFIERVSSLREQFQVDPDLSALTRAIANA